ncbi:MAG: hydrogenase large subunit [Candidatus Micrarchaeota archaeon]|nr:hydrogenase large subunit [Candidatus Micrarchaeota archaeon]
MDTQTKKFIAELSKGSIGDKLSVVDTESAIWIETAPKNMEHLCISCIGLSGTFDSGFAYPHSKAGEWAATYLFRVPKIGKLVALWTHSRTFYSISNSIQAALWDERKMCEMSGREFVGLQDQRPIVIHPESAKFGKGKIRKRKAIEYLFSGTGAEEEFQIPVGPVHAGIIEPGHFRFHVIGEKINKLEVRLSYLHKGIESLAQNRDAESLFPLIEQISGDESVANSVAYAQAIEVASGIEVPSRANSLRLILLEMERVYNHLADLGGMSMDIGYYASSSQFLILREESMRLNESIFGNRFLRGMILVGGVSRNISVEKLQQLKSALAIFLKSFSDVEALTMTSSTFLDRVFTTGRVFPQTAMDLSLVGPTARACGISCDLRKHFPYSGYKSIPVVESLADDGDVLARFLVKFKEVLESIRLIRLAASEISSGPISADASRKIAKVKSGAFGIGACEASRGGCTFLVQFGKKGRIANLSIRTASFRNWRAIEKAVKSNIIADFPLINKSFNLSYSGADL